MKKNQSPAGGEKPAFKIVKNNDFFYYAVRMSGLTLATFNFATFANEIKESDQSVKALFYSGNLEIKMMVRKLNDLPATVKKGGKNE